jgi:hypothetical protein
MSLSYFNLMGELINLNSIAFNEQITVEDILKHVTQEDIYSYYLGQDVSNLGVYHSPLRDDNIPSFALFFHRDQRNVIMFRDFATNDTGDFVVMVQKLYGVGYKDALNKVAYDLGLSKVNIDLQRQPVNYTRIVEKDKVELGIKRREWLLRDREYWSSFGIIKATLERFRVYPISHVFYNDTAVKAHDYAYAYVEDKDGIITYKIYQPFETKQRKWINNANYSVHQGYTQLPKRGWLLIITKSLKDVMSINDCLGVAAVGLQSESVMMKASVMDEYKSRFNRVICLFDNDHAGKKLSETFTETYQVPHFFVPELPNVTDFSDLVKVLGKEDAVQIVKQFIH